MRGFGTGLKVPRAFSVSTKLRQRVYPSAASGKRLAAQVRGVQQVQRRLGCRIGRAAVMHSFRLSGGPRNFDNFVPLAIQ